MLLSKIFTICAIFLMAIAVCVLSADTIPGGNVSGIWFADSSPYYVMGDITLPEFDTLIIEPGVEVFLQGNTFYA